MEYIKDAGWFFDQLKACTKKIALSYKGKEGGFERSQYTTDEVIRMLYARGFILTQWDQEFKDEWPLLACFEKVSPQLLGRNYFCMGCGACVSACPVSALYMEPDDLGFLKPGIDLHVSVGQLYFLFAEWMVVIIFVVIFHSSKLADFQYAE